MLQYRQICIHPPLNTVLRAGLLCAIQTTRSYFPRNAFLPADIGKMVDGLLDVGLLGFVFQKLVQFSLVRVAELGDVDLRLGVHFAIRNCENVSDTHLIFSF